MDTQPIQDALAEIAAGVRPTRRWEIERELLKAVPELLAEIDLRRVKHEDALANSRQFQHESEQWKANHADVVGKKQRGEELAKAAYEAVVAERDAMRAVLQEFREWQQNKEGTTHRPIQDISASAAELLTPKASAA